MRSVRVRAPPAPAWGAWGAGAPGAPGPRWRPASRRPARPLARWRPRRAPCDAPAGAEETPMAPSQPVSPGSARVSSRHSRTSVRVAISGPPQSQCTPVCSARAGAPPRRRRRPFQRPRGGAGVGAPSGDVYWPLQLALTTAAPGGLPGHRGAPASLAGARRRLGDARWQLGACAAMHVGQRRPLRRPLPPAADGAGLGPDLRPGGADQDRLHRQLLPVPGAGGDAPSASASTPSWPWAPGQSGWAWWP